MFDSYKESDAESIASDDFWTELFNGTNAYLKRRYARNANQATRGVCTEDVASEVVMSILKMLRRGGIEQFAVLDEMAKTVHVKCWSRLIGYLKVAAQNLFDNKVRRPIRNRKPDVHQSDLEDNAWHAVVDSRSHQRPDFVKEDFGPALRELANRKCTPTHASVVTARLNGLTRKQIKDSLAVSDATCTRALQHFKAAIIDEFRGEWGICDHILADAVL